MTQSLANLVVVQVTWQKAQYELSQVRTAVFIEEQQVAPDFEWDELDQNAVHLLAKHSNLVIACLRIIDYKKIGRMAVIKSWRGKGVGKALLTEAIKVCTAQGSQQINLSAQTHAIGFYRNAGFKIISREYTDVNIAHVDMQLSVHNID